MWGKRRKRGRLTEAVREARDAHARELFEAEVRKARAEILTIRADRAASKIRTATDAFTEAMTQALQGRSTR